MKNYFKITIEKPYIELNHQKIFLFYDQPHLLKNIRNNMKNQILNLNGNDNKWKYLLEFNEYDKESEVKYAPKLTDEHFDLPSNRK